MIRRLASATLFLAIGSTAMAQPAPRIRPARDVAVTYKVDGDAIQLVPGGLQGGVTLFWDAAGQRLRAEAAGKPQVALIDLRQHTAQAFDPNLRLAVPLPIRPQDLTMLTLENARLTPTRRETVAGLSCNGYRFDSPQGPGAVCLTPDGVPLRGEGTVNGKPGSFVATAVQYGPIGDDRFTVPPGTMSLGGSGGQSGEKSGLAGLAQKLGGSGLSLKGLLGGNR